MSYMGRRQSPQWEVTPEKGSSPRAEAQWRLASSGEYWDICQKSIARLRAGMSVSRSFIIRVALFVRRHHNPRAAVGTGDGILEC